MPLRHCPARIYKYFGPKGDVIDSLIQGLLRYTPLGAFNDPFEGRPGITGLHGDPQMLKSLDQEFTDQIEQMLDGTLAKNVAEQYELLPPNDKANVSFDQFKVLLLAELKSHGGNFLPFVQTNMPAIVNVIYQQFDSRIGACSFSEVPDSLLMWAHYGAWHSGFVVEFNAHHPYFHEQVSPEDELRHLRRVLYRSSRTSALLSELSGTEMFLVKSEHWAYEREWRILRAFEHASHVIPHPIYPIHLFAFPLEAVTTVILGARIQPDTEEHVRRLLAAVSRSSNVNLKRVVPDESNFVLRIKEDAS